MTKYFMIEKLYSKMQLTSCATLIKLSQISYLMEWLLLYKLEFIKKGMWMDGMGRGYLLWKIILLYTYQLY